MTIKRTLRTVGLAALTALAGAPARAIDPAAGTSGASFMKIGIGSARALAMGRAYVAAADGTEAMTWNPAGLAVSQQKEFSYSYMRYVQDIDAPLFMAYAHPLGRTVIGANAAYVSVDGFDVRDSQGRPLNSSEVRVQDGFATFSAARSFWFEKVHLGASVKAIHEDNDGTVRDVIVGDVGAMFRPNSYVTLAFASQNFGAGSSRVALVNRGGAAFRLWGLVTASIELSKASDSSARLGLGGEFTLPEDLLQLGQVYLRAGYYSADDLGEALEDERSFLYPLVGSPKLSFGLGVYTAQAFGYGLSFDYTFISLGALGNADMITLKVRF